MGIFSFLERSAGDSRIAKDWQKTYDLGKGVVAGGDKLTDEGLTGLRSLDSTYQGRLNDPLGSVGRGIFSMARGKIGDDAIRGQRAFGSRISQLARQGGGFLAPEAQGELTAQNERDINESRFGAERDLGIAEADMTLSETGKLFDRMEGIRKTIVGVGQDEKTRGLQSIIAALTGRTGRQDAIWSKVVGLWGAMGK